MKLYFAWADNKAFYDLLIKNEVSRMLTSYYHTRKSKNEINPGNIDMLLDSWAFTAFTKNAIIDIQEYIRFLQINKSKFILYAWLDVIWDAEATLKNQKILDKTGLKAFPTYHLWSPIKYFHNLVENYDYIWLWWMVPHSANPKKIEAFLDYCFNYIKKHNLKTKIHWWGMTNPRLMLKYPFYSVDSTAWLTPWKFNRIPFFKKWKFNVIDNKKAKNLWIDFSKIHYMDRYKYSIKAYLELEKYVTNIQKIKKMEYYNN